MRHEYITARLKNTGSTWRYHSYSVILPCVRESEGLSVLELEIEIRKLYPFGEKAMHPYKIWLDCVKQVMALAREYEKRQKPADKPGILLGCCTSCGQPVVDNCALCN